MTYLSGFLAKKRNIERENVAGEVKARIDGYSQTLLMNTIQGYTAVVPNSLQVQANKLTWDYALMPVWILTYIQKGKKDKVYTYALNGHTGKIYGELPLSMGKLAALFFGMAAGVTLLLALILFIGGLL